MRRTALMFALAGMVGALVATPIAVYATHQFTDVSDSAFYSNSVDWMKDNGITVGCNPPSNTKYCPNDNVSRGEMAVFLKRVSEKNVVDAGELQGFTAAQLTPRAAFNNTNDAPDQAAFTLPTTITAPAPGILLMSGGVDAFGFGATSDSQYFCEFEVDGVPVTGSRRTSNIDNDSTDNHSEDCTTSGALTVTAGTHTIEFHVDGQIANIGLNNASVSAVWIPFDGNGNTP